MVKKKGKKKGGMYRFWWIPVVVIGASMLTGCEAIKAWAEGAAPQDGVTPPAGGAPGLPQVGGTDPLDMIATVLALLGLPTAARLVGLAKPFVASLILAIVGKKKVEPTPPAAE